MFIHPLTKALLLSLVSISLSYAATKEVAIPQGGTLEEVKLETVSRKPTETFVSTKEVKPEVVTCKPTEAFAPVNSTKQVKAEVVQPQLKETHSAGTVIHLKNKKELDEALHYAGPKVLKFSTEWCGPCKKIKKHIETLAAQYPEVRVYEINDNDDFRSCMQTYGVLGFPTLIFLPTNKQFVGARSFAEFEAAFKAIAQLAKK